MKDDKSYLQQLCEQYLRTELDYEGEQRLHELLSEASSLTDEQSAVLALLEVEFPDDADKIIAEANPKAKKRVGIALSLIAAAAAVIAFIFILWNTPQEKQQENAVISYKEQPTVHHETAKPEKSENKLAATEPTPEKAVMLDTEMQDERVAAKEKEAEQLIAQAYAKAERLLAANNEMEKVRTAEQEADSYVEAKESLAYQKIEEIDKYMP